MAPLPSIGILGSGPVGQGLARLLSGAGDDVTLGTRTPAAVKLRGLPTKVLRSTFDEAARADCVFVAVLHSDAWLSGHAEAAGSTDQLTEGAWMARLLPDSHVTGAFSPIDRNKQPASGP